MRRLLYRASADTFQIKTRRINEHGSSVPTNMAVPNEKAAKAPYALFSAPLNYGERALLCEKAATTPLPRALLTTSAIDTHT